ncbi:uncharacterized protein PITG_19156 [Phytophthora infestans T30-4]|uniref:Uncharacterized protein n=1 Tax=Phytophthora infestans (strain T30-4) TaxID=403677 RepID=D0NYZ2_PHYIT|nr:uncharacterized protein PITG_19156 [Phytophthora infestans T30-4]EEY68775.1 conserved hypothetical protein [Phytophthora infestans T30-4]|eukprot:XP_002997467.1 conserved hypothetical protein [Phytophthora infestans T30-4]
MAPSGRRRVGHSLRRSRRRSAANGRVSTRSTAGAGPLQAIGENTVLSKKRKKKRPRESTALQSEKKRKQHLERLLDELDTQVQEQCDQLISDAERRAQDLEMELKIQLVYLPEAVRRMPWKTFAEDYGGDLQNVIQSLSQPSPPRAQSSVSRHDIVAATPCSNRRLSAFTTPMYRRRAGEVPKTVLRAAHKGETFYSVRGSPIIPDSSTSNCLRLDNERVVDLSRPEQLSAKSRGEATSKLKDLQAKVAQLLQQLNPCSR